MTPAQVAHIMELVDAYGLLRAQRSTYKYDGGVMAKRLNGKADEARAAVEAALRDAPQAEPKRCPYCDDTGDVHSIDGEWRGTCKCQAGKATPSAPTAVEPDERAKLERDWFEKAVDSFIEDYEMIGETEDGRDACYTPNDNDKALIKDAIMGLFGDPEWDRLWGAHIESLVQARASKGTPL